MRQRLLIAFVILAAAAVLLPPSEGYADQIDGHWCLKKPFKRLSIDGNTIITPRGSRATGENTHHGFTYQVPSNEPGAGSVVVMDQLSDDEIHLRTGADRKSAQAAKPQSWGICPPNIS
jgi:hypothetical protein